MNDLAALLGGGAAPAAPLPSGLGPSPQGDPLMAALMGGGAGAMPADPMADPMAMMGGGAPPMPGMDPMGGAPAPAFPMTDPAVVGSMLEQLLMGQQAEHEMLSQQHQMALLGNPLLEALMSGSPLGPGAGQDAQGIGPGVGDIAPDPMMPV